MIENNGGRLGYPLIAMVDEAPVQLNIEFCRYEIPVSALRVRGVRDRELLE